MTRSPQFPVYLVRQRPMFFFYQIKSRAVILYENDKTGIAAKSLKADGPCAGKKIEHFCSLDRFPKDTK